MDGNFDMSETSAASVDAQLLREVMGHYPTGDSRDGRGYFQFGFAGSSACILHADEDLAYVLEDARMLVSVHQYPWWRARRRCADDRAQVGEQTRRYRMASLAVLDDSVAWIDTCIFDIVEAGDHWIVLCSVEDMSVTNAVSPLIFFQGGYGSFVCTSLMARMDHEILPAIHSAHSARLEVEELASTVGCEVTVYTTVSPDEVAAVLSAAGPGIEVGGDFGKRAPMVPPVGDSYYFAQPPERQDEWVERLRGVDDELKEVHRERLHFLAEHGYVFSLLPAEEGRSAYDGLRAATNEYATGRLTPSQERSIRQSMAHTVVDYRVREFEDAETYDLGSLVLPVRDRNGAYSGTLRLAQLPFGATKADIEGWLNRARKVVEVLEVKTSVSS